MTPKARQCPVVQGPCIDGLFESLKKGKEVTFTIMVGTHRVQIRVRIVKIELEDGSYQSWCVTGYVMPAGTLVHGHYMTSDRTGFLYLPVQVAA
ncbi:MAG: hypothetical protein PHH13_03870 [Candidatus Peribacteraceae bacterium]|nr:hypothetical protein [Candidatus Peribacteraceae bacterium]